MTRSHSVVLIGTLAIVQAFLLLLPQAILGAAIDWPNSLDFPPSQALPVILTELGQVRLGYGIYLLYSVIWAPLGIGIAWWAQGSGRPIGPIFVAASAFIVASALARSIGIIRWLTASTYLAMEHSTASPDATFAIEMVQTAVNAWGGAVGELLGVSMFTVFWLMAVSVLIIRSDGSPNWLAWLSFAVAFILSTPLIELFGMTANLFLSTVAIQVWLFVAGVTIIGLALRQKADEHENAPPSRE